MSDYVIINDKNQFMKFLKPIEMIWKPKEDITAFELAQCMPYLVRIIPVMPYEINKNAKYLRHFEIIDPNEEEDNNDKM